MSEPEANGQHSKRGQMTHLDTDVVAEFRAGLITGRRGAKIAAHLAGCDRCAALDDELAGVSALLASVPAPPIPDSVAQRLETVLAAEVARKNYAERGEVDRPGESGAHDRRPAKRGFRLATWRVLVPAGAVAVLPAGGFGLSRITRGPEGQPASSSAAGTAPASAAAGSAAKGLSRAPVPSASTINGAALAPRRALPLAYLRVVTSHTDFTPAQLKQQLIAALRVPEGTTHAAPTQTRGCVAKVAGKASLVRVFSAMFEGQPATVIVARTGQHDMAWVVAPSCSAASHDLLDTHHHALGNLRALVSVHWSASQMRG